MKTAKLLSVSSTYLDILNHIKKRPKMYLGNGVPMLSLIEGLLSDCIALCGTDAILFSMNILMV